MFYQLKGLIRKNVPPPLRHPCRDSVAAHPLSIVILQWVGPSSIGGEGGNNPQIVVVGGGGGATSC